MSNPLAEYLSSLEARDAREKAHEQYINAYTKLADRTAAQSKAALSAEPPAFSPNASQKTIKGKSSPAPAETNPSAGVEKLRSELANTQKTRAELESKLSSQSTELSSYKVTDAEQKKRIAQLEKAKEALERRAKDRVEELKGKGRFVEEVQDEMVAQQLQLNMAEKEVEKLKKENAELTSRWVEKMEKEARSMNDRMGWKEGVGKKK